MDQKGWLGGFNFCSFHQFCFPDVRFQNV